MSSVDGFIGKTHVVNLIRLYNSAMYLIKVTIRASAIEGKGVFAGQEINKGEIVWKFTDGHDQTLTVGEYGALSQAGKDHIDKVAYFSPTSHLYIFPPENDPALYTNHDAQNHNLSALTDPTVSSEPYFIANRDIASGEELTNNYHEFDQAIRSKVTVPVWLR